MTYIQFRSVPTLRYYYYSSAGRKRLETAFNPFYFSAYVVKNGCGRRVSAAAAAAAAADIGIIIVV